MRRLLIITLLVGTVIAVSVPTACAMLTPMAWGMPMMVSSGSTTAFQNYAAAATDNQAAAVAFPTAGSCLGLVSAFPSIAQTSLQSQALNSIGLLNQNYYNYFAYPYVSIGGAPIPSMGFF